MKIARRLAEDDGMSLIELVITVVIMSITFVALFGAMAVAIELSDRHRKHATAEAAIRSLAEEVKKQFPGPCPNPSYSAPQPPDRFAQTITVEECAPELHRLRLTVASDDGKVSETLQVLVRNPNP